MVSILFLVTASGQTTSEYSEKNWYQPSLHTSWQWQLSKKINTTYNVKMYDVDLFDTNPALIQKLHNKGKKIICYFSAGSYENWRSDINAFSKKSRGEVMDGWENEQWLDIRDESLHSIMILRLDLAKEKGCDGVEPDNVDGYLNQTGFNLSFNDQLKYNKFIAKEAHTRGLSVGLKNDLEQVVLLEPYFDFSVNEQCHEYEECEMLLPFIEHSKPVFNAEYQKKYIKNTANERDRMCESTVNMSFSTLVLPLDLDDSFRYSCTPDVETLR